MTAIPFAHLSATTYIRWLDTPLQPDDVERLRLVWELALRDGRLRAFFYDMDCEPDFATFAAWAIAPERWFFLLYRNHVPAAFVCLEGLCPTGSQRLAHFCTLGTAPRPALVALGRDFVRWLGRATAIRQLLGITPACYRHALAFVREVGFARLAVLKDAVPCRGRVRNAVLTLCATAA